MRRPSVGPIHAYHFSDVLTGLVICSMMVFSPWAFGTTEPWSIWTMNVCGYVLGVLQLAKVVIRKATGYRPRRWDTKPIEPGAIRKERGSLCGDVEVDHLSGKARNNRLLAGTLALSTCGILGFCLIAVLNARAIYHVDSMTFEYCDYVPWLPSSIDRRSTLASFWNYLGIACSFWAAWDWLQGKSRADQRCDSPYVAPGLVERSPLPLPCRLRRLLWILTLSGGLLAVEGIIQRLSHSAQLLFFLKPQIHLEAVEQFASYAYRANAGQYFNLLWPVCLGFWWVLLCSNGKRVCKWPVLLCAGVMAVCPIISGARGAALVDLGLLLAALVALWGCFLRRPRVQREAKWILASHSALFMAGVLTVGFGLGWKQLGPRLALMRSGLAEREQLYEPARRMAADYPLFGTGPGTFERVFQIYRNSLEDYWPAQLHNDWLETRVTWGLLGTALVLMSLFVVLLRWFIAAGISNDPALFLLIWLSLLGCLVQARWDFPLQVYSILLLFVVWCAVLFALPRQL